MKFTDQSVNDLVLNLIPYDRDISDLMVLVDNTVSNEKFIVVFGIIGASHFAKITDKFTGNTMMEVFACVDLHEDEIYSQRVTDTADNASTVNGFDYVFASEIITTSNDRFSQAFENEMDNSNKNGLQFVFPKRDNDVFDPLTTISVVFENGSVNISTMHAYPNENAITITKTQIRGNE